MKGRILFAHGARDPAWAQPILAIREAMRARAPAAPVEAAFLEFIEPSLPQAIDTLAAAGCDEVVVVPMFMAQSGHTKRDLPALLDEARTRHPQLKIAIAMPIGEAPPVIAAITDYALRA